MQYSVLIASALAGFAAAATQPDTTKFPTPGSDNPITAPLNEKVPAGKPFTVKWTPTTGDKVSLYLLKGPSTNAVIYKLLADSIPNSGTFVWTPDTSLAPTTDATGYGLELVVEGTGQYQYSTQIGIDNANPNSGSSSSSGSSSASYGAVETAPSSGTTQGTAVGGALNPTSSSAQAVVTLTTSCSSDVAAPAVTGATGTANVSMPIVSPTGQMTVPSSLATVAAPGSTDAPSSGSGSSGSGTGSSDSGASGSAAAAPKSTGISTGAAVATGVQLTGTVAAIAGLLSYFAL